MPRFVMVSLVFVSLLICPSVAPGLAAEPEAKTFTAAAIQAHSQFGEPAANREKLARLVRQAARHGARVIVLPETAVTGYLTDDLKQAWQLPGRELSPGLTGVDPREAAETVPGPSCEFFGKMAAELGVYVTVPLLEIDRKTGFCYNTSLLFGPTGQMLIHYRKRNPWPWAELGWG
ncbi:MAG: carbon-nitrogen hydrolase family protein, partial [Patescibacteria group bacterium]|nr:carbon-nitrogen hydrolase family protein [Patescibacteria group bacterium]